MKRILSGLFVFCLVILMMIPHSSAEAGKPTKLPRATKTQTPTPTSTSSVPTSTVTPTYTATITATATNTATATSTSTSTSTPEPQLRLTPNWTVPTLQPNCSSAQSNGSEMLFCKPASPAGGTFWYANLVIFAHGYVNPYFAPGKLPWDQLIFKTDTGDIVSFNMVNEQGYYFATTSYRANGLVVQDAIQDLRLLSSWAKTKIGFRLLGINVIVVGASEGGLVTTLSIERYSREYMGGMSMCGPVGNFKQQVDYWGNFRALNDAYFNKPFYSYAQDGILSDAVNIPNNLISDWYGNLGDSAYKQNVLNAELTDLDKAKDLLDHANAPYGPLPSTDATAEANAIRDTISGLLDYNIFATMNGKVVLGGNPYGNQDVTYTGSTYFTNPSLNDSVERYDADPTALANLAPYETTGNISIPLVLLHNRGDPIVPVFHATQYAEKVPAGREFAVQISESYGHCNFTETEILNAFNILGGYLTSSMMAQAKTDLTPEQQKELYQLLQSEGKIDANLQVISP